MNNDKQINNLQPMALEDIMGDRFGRYSKYIIQERALPDARDGLKPVQRRILYAMFHDGNTHDKAHRKSAKTVGLVIGNYHPHGDSSVYEAMVRMSQTWKMREPLIDMHGNNGSIDDDPAAAMRYTEARISKIAQSMLDDLDKDTVLFTPNFDDTEEEPTVLPSRFPTLLVNGTTGIAAGYATNMAPHNLGEVIEATIYRLQNRNCDLSEIMQIMPGPDFPTGGIVQGRAGITDAFATGKGKVVVRAKTEVKDAKTMKQIVITEIPYEVIKSNLVRKMDEIRLNKDIDGIQDVRDESDRTGLRIVIDVRKDSDPNFILNYLFKNTDLQIYYNYNNVAIVKKRPVQMGLLALMDAFIDHREEVVLRRSRFQYNKMEYRCQILEGLMKAVSIMDEIIVLIRQSKDKADAKINLMNAFLFTEIQAEAIVTMRLYRLTSTDITQLREEFAQIVNDMEYLKTVIDNDKVLRSVIVNELKEVKTLFSNPRRSIIQEEIEEIVIDKLSMITNERVMVTASRDGYLKRVSLRSFSASGENSSTGLKETDCLIGTCEVDTLDTLLLFTNRGNYAYLPVYQIEDSRWKDVGTHINNYVKLESEEKLINVVAVKNFVTQAWIVSVSKNGQIKRSLMSEWLISRNNKTACAMNLKGKDEVVKTLVAYLDDEIILISKNGYTCRYSLDLVTSTATKSQGVKAMNLVSGDEIVDACLVQANKNAVLVMNDKAMMKRIKLADITVTNRAVKGEMIVKKVKSNPHEITSIQAVSAYDSIQICDPDLQVIQAKDVPFMNKDAGLSSVVVVKPEWYWIKGIEEVRIIDIDESLITKSEEIIEEGSDNLDSEIINEMMEDLDEIENEETHGDFEMLSFELK